MATPLTFNDPAFGASDLHNARLELAYEEGHDADIPSNLGVYVPDDDRSDRKSDKSTQKSDRLDGDLEKGFPSPDGRGEAEEPTDPNIVGWESDTDPLNPMNWPEKKKWANIAVLSIVTFLTPLASSIFAPGVPDVMKDFHETSTELATFVVSVYLLGFTVGPLLMAPLSEMYGRVPLYNICNIFFTIFTACCGLSTSMGMLIAFRLLAGVVGVAPLTIGAGSIADMMPTERRGSAMAIWAMGPLFGPVVGPIAGGYLAQAKGWKWIFWLLTMLAGASLITSFLFMRETYAPVILERKAARLRKETGNPNLRSKLASNISHRELLKLSIVRPSKMLLFSPIVSLCSLYTAVAYGILYILFTTYTFVFEEQYGFSSGTVGLTYIGSGVGMLLGLLLLGSMSDRYVKKIQASAVELRPEHRMPLHLTLPGAISTPIGLFIYGWSADKMTHWIVPIIGTGLVGFGLISVMMTVQTYLVDAFAVHAASAMAANAVLRSLFGAVLPLCGLQMYDSLGLGWGNSLLGFIALGLIPIPFLMGKYGHRIRTNPKFQVKL